MIKKAVFSMLTFLLVGGGAYMLHNNYLVNNHLSIPFNLQDVYLFFAIFSMVLCLLFLFGSVINKVKEQLGFVYLATILLKILFFSGLFYNQVFVVDLSVFQRLTLLIPMGLLLIIEVIFVAQILKKNLSN